MGRLLRVAIVLLLAETMVNFRVIARAMSTVAKAFEANAVVPDVEYIDPDNYDGPEKVYREWHHWLVVNIPGSDVAKGEVISPYIGSGPPEGTGIHRYVYLLYKQPGKLSFDEKKLTNKSIDGRAAFSTEKFAEKYNLGNPVAGNFYRAQFDDHVPLLYKSLGV